MYKLFFNAFMLLCFFCNSSLQANVIILNGLTHIHNGEKGKQMKGEIVLQNLNKTNAQRVSVYVQDLLQSCDGKTEYTQVGSHSRSLGNWITFNTTEKLLSPNEKFVITYFINIPDEINVDDLDYGSFWSALMIDVDKPINEDVQYGVQINSKIRYGVQIVANVGERLNPEIQFEKIDLNKVTDAQYQLDVVVRNNGFYLVQPTLILELFDQEGVSVKKVEALFKKVYPMHCKGFEVAIEGLPVGDYDAVLIADYGGDIFGTNLTISISK
jgi:hypothetical protein